MKFSDSALCTLFRATGTKSGQLYSSRSEFLGKQNFGKRIHRAEPENFIMGQFRKGKKKCISTKFVAKVLRQFLRFYENGLTTHIEGRDKTRHKLEEAS